MSSLHYRHLYIACGILYPILVLIDKENINIVATILEIVFSILVVIVTAMLVLDIIKIKREERKIEDHVVFRLFFNTDVHLMNAEEKYLMLRLVACALAIIALLLQVLFSHMKYALLEIVMAILVGVFWILIWHFDEQEEVINQIRKTLIKDFEYIEKSVFKVSFKE